MLKPISNHLRLVVDDNRSADLETRFDLPGLNTFLKAFEELTSWTLQCQVSEPVRADRALGRMTMSVDGELEYLCLNPLAADAKQGMETPLVTRQFGQGLARILTELQSTRRALWQREAELATAIPVVSDQEDASQLASRIQSVLRGTVECLDGTAAALYLLDDATSKLKLRSHWGLPHLRFVEPARPLRGAMADLEALTGKAVVLEDTREFPHWNVPEEYLSAICVPVTGPNAILGTLWFFCERVRDFSSQDTQLVEMSAGRLATELERRVLLNAVDDNQSLQNQQEAIQQWVQDRARIVPPMLDGWSVSQAQLGPADSAGFHHWRLLDQDHLMVALSGMRGAGPQGVLTSALIRGALQSQIQFTEEVAEVLQNLNQVTWASSPSPAPCSMMLARIDTENGWVESASAGTMDAYILRPHGWEPIVRDELPLGIEPETGYLKQRHQIARGDILVIMNDRKLEPMDDGLDTTQIAETLLRHSHLTTQEIAQLAVQLIQEQVGDEQARSVVVVKRDDP